MGSTVYKKFSLSVKRLREKVEDYAGRVNEVKLALDTGVDAAETVKNLYNSIRDIIRILTYLKELEGCLSDLDLSGLPSPGSGPSIDSGPSLGSGPSPEDPIEKLKEAKNTLELVKKLMAEIAKLKEDIGKLYESSSKFYSDLTKIYEKGLKIEHENSKLGADLGTLDYETRKLKAEMLIRIRAAINAVELDDSDDIKILEDFYDKFDEVVTKGIEEEKEIEFRKGDGGAVSITIHDLRRRTKPPSLVLRDSIAAVAGALSGHLESGGSQQDFEKELKDKVDEFYDALITLQQCSALISIQQRAVTREKQKADRALEDKKSEGFELQPELFELEKTIQILGAKAAEMAHAFLQLEEIHEALGSAINSSLPFLKGLSCPAGIKAASKFFSNYMPDATVSTMMVNLVKNYPEMVLGLDSLEIDIDWSKKIDLFKFSISIPIGSFAGIITLFFEAGFKVDVNIVIKTKGTKPKLTNLSPEATGEDLLSLTTTFSATLSGSLSFAFKVNLLGLINFGAEAEGVISTVFEVTPTIAIKRSSDPRGFGAFQVKGGASVWLIVKATLKLIVEFTYVIRKVVKLITDVDLKAEYTVGECDVYKKELGALDVSLTLDRLIDSKDFQSIIDKVRNMSKEDVPSATTEKITGAAAEALGGKDKAKKVQKGMKVYGKLPITMGEINAIRSSLGLEELEEVEEVEEYDLDLDYIISILKDDHLSPPERPGSRSARHLPLL